jgi:predicted glycogen debranching enzyme
MNSRREHGLLVIPHENTGKKAILLSKFEESIFVDNHLHDISTNTYRDITFPKGHKFQQKFEMNPFPRFIYQVEDRIIHKTLFLLENRNILILRYELRNQGRPIKIILKPFLSGRYNNVLADDLQGFNTDTYLGQHYVRWAPKADMPELNVYYNRGEFISATLWYHNFHYSQDLARYGFSTEDLFNPGFFQATLKPYEAFDLYLSPEEVTDIVLDYDALYSQEALARGFSGEDDFRKPAINHYRARAQRVISEPCKWTSVNMSSYSGSNQTRDLFLSLPGLCLADGRFGPFKMIFTNLVQELQNGLLPATYPEIHEKNYGTADLSLLLINIGYLYWTMSKDISYFEGEIFEALQSIIHHYEKGAAFNIYCDKDGLVFCGDRATSLSGIPLKSANGDVLRHGKLLEINALWYSSLRIMEVFAAKLNKKKLVERYNKFAERARTAFNRQFINETKLSFYDFILNNQKNEDFRSVQIIPLILPFTPVPDAFAKQVLMRIDEELLTPYGLRSQSKYDPGFRQTEDMPVNRRTAEYYCGSVWPWTQSLYIRACLKYRREKTNLAEELRTYFAPLQQLADSGLLGYIPEAVNMNQHIRQSGIEDFTPSLADIIWSEYLLNQIHNN